MAKGNGDNSVVIKIGGAVDKTWQSSLNNVGTSLSRLGKHISKNMRDFTHGSKSVETYKNEVEYLNKVLTEGNATTKGYYNAIDNTSAKYNLLQEKTDKAKVALEGLRVELEELKKAGETGNWGKFLTEKQKVKATAGATDSDFVGAKTIGSKRKEIADIKGSKGYKEATEEVIKLNEQLNEYRKKLASLEEGQRGWKTANKNVETYTKKVAKAQSAVDEYTKQIRKLENDIKKLTTAESISEKSELYSKVKQMGIENYAKSIESVQKKIEQYENTIKTNKITMQSYQATVENTFAKLNEYISSTELSLGRYESLLQQAQEKTENASQNIKQTLVTYVVNGVIDAFNKAGNAFKSFAKGAAKWLGKAAGVIAQTATNAKTLQKMFKKVIQYGFGFRSLYYLLNNIKSALADGLAFISQATSSANAGVAEVATEMKEALKTVKELVYFLKSAGAAMIQPFVQLLPYIQKLVDWFAKLSASVATVVAQFTGQAYIIKASTNLEDYSNALEETASSAKDATKALGAYDKLNVISQDKSSSGTSSDIDTGSWFTKEDIDANPFIDKVKSALTELLSLTTEMGDELKQKFTSIGADIGAWISEGLGSIDWEGILTKAFNFSTALASVINGILLDPNLGTQVGNSVAQFLNTIVLFTSTFFDTMDWSQLGTQIAIAINSAFTTFNFEQLGEGIHNIAEGIMTVLSTVLSDPNLGTNIGTALGELLRGLDLKSLLGDLADLAGDIISALSDALKAWAETDPESFGIAKAIVIALGSAKVIGAVTGGLTSLLGAAAKQAITDKFTKDLSDKFATSMSEAAVDAATSTTGSEGFASAGFLGGAAVSIGLGTAITAFVSQWKSGFDLLSQIILTVGAVFAGVGAAMLLGVSVVTGGIIGLAVALVAGLVILIRDNWDAIKQWATDAWESIKTWFSNLKQGISDWWDDVKQGWSDFWSGLGEKWDTFKDNLANAWSTFWGDIKTKATEKWDDIKQKWSDFCEKINTKWNNLKTTFGSAWNNFWNNIGTKWKNFWQGLKDNAKSFVNGIIGIINKMLSAIQSGLNWAVNKLNKFSFTLPSFLGGGHVGFNLGQIELTQIPYLAQGAVIPPNKEFMAVLGDQKSGTNIEAPLDTIKQALAETLSAYAGGTNQPIVLQLDGKTVAKVVWDENKKRYKQTGKSYAC